MQQWMVIFRSFCALPFVQDDGYDGDDDDDDKNYGMVIQKNRR